MKTQKTATFKESDLYAPVKRFFEALGYAVQGEVCGCDLTAQKDGQLVIVEFKKSFGLKLIYQAIDRQKIARDVYVCVPRPAKYGRDVRQNMLGLVKRLGLGLLTVAVDSPLKTVDVLVCPEDMAAAPRNKKRENRLLEEIAGRRLDLNIGGGSRAKINTAYRERAVKIACILEKAGQVSAKELVADYGCAADAWRIMSGNAYGWFEKREKGVYGLSAAGRTALNEEGLRPLTDYYRNAERLGKR